MCFDYYVSNENCIFVSEDQKYICKNALYITMDTQINKYAHNTK